MSRPTDGSDSCAPSGRAVGVALVVGAAATVLASCLDVGVGAVGLLGAGFALVGLLAGIDWASGRIPNQLVLPGLAAAVAIIAIATPAVGSLSLLVGAATGVLVVAGPLTLAALVSDRQAVGGGDVKLAALVGMLTGVVDVLAAETALAVVLAGWVLLALSSRARGRRMFVLGPVLAFAGLVGLAVAALLSAQGVDVKLKNLVALVLSGRT